MARRRLDSVLMERGLFRSRSAAAAAILAGDVHVGPGRDRAGKPGELVHEDVVISVRQRPTYVSRGGVKLENALEALDLDVADRNALDVGASTGGFTDCLLQRGARRVIALDVAYGQLSYQLRTDRRVHVIERVNARTISSQMLPYLPDLAVIDVSFISLRKVLPAVLQCLGAKYDVLALVKPQFEVGRERVGGGGVVRDPEHRRSALIDVGRCALELRASVLAYRSSGLPGPKGNRESFVWIGEPSRAGAAADDQDLLRMAMEAEQQGLEDACGSGVRS